MNNFNIDDLRKYNKKYNKKCHLEYNDLRVISLMIQ